MGSPGLIAPVEIVTDRWGIDLERNDYDAIGSNNRVVHGTRTLSGYPIMANDPHRAQSAPWLRYWVHLVAPGWNVIGGGEPVLPGVSIGHNEHGAWGLTVFGQDNEHLYVYRRRHRAGDRERRAHLHRQRPAGAGLPARRRRQGPGGGRLLAAGQHDRRPSAARSRPETRIHPRTGGSP